MDATEDGDARSERDLVVDPDVDLHDPAQRGETRPRQWDLIAATSLGGAIGTLSRYGVGVAMPHGTGAFPWSTVVINSTGSLVIGVLMVIVLELTAPHRLLRPFLGVGVIGGYTTYSTFAVDAQRLVEAHRPGVALAYMAVTVVTCAIAVWLAASLTRIAGAAIVTRRRLRGRSR